MQSRVVVICEAFLCKQRDWLTYTTENITFPQLHWRAVNTTGKASWHSCVKFWIIEVHQTFCCSSCIIIFYFLSTNWTWVILLPTKLCSYNKFDKCFHPSTTTHRTYLHLWWNKDLTAVSPYLVFRNYTKLAMLVDLAFLCYTLSLFSCVHFDISVF